MLFIRANAGQGGDDGGSGLREVGFRLGETLILSTLCFVVGVVVFQRLQMRGKES